MGFGGGIRGGIQRAASGGRGAGGEGVGGGSRHHADPSTPRWGLGALQASHSCIRGQWFPHFAVLGLLDVLKNHWGPRRALIYVGSSCCYLLCLNLKWRKCQNQVLTYLKSREVTYYIVIRGTYFYEKSLISKAKKKIISIIFYFVNLFDIWLHRRQMDSHISVCFRAVLIYYSR